MVLARSQLKLAPLLGVGWEWGGGYGIEANARAKVTQERPEAARFMVTATMGLQNTWT